MKKIISYRDELLELARIYKISEIKNYIKNKKHLTSAQIEHILKKNKVPIPKEINKSLLEIHKKNISKPFNFVGSITSSFVKSTNDNIINFFFKSGKRIKLTILDIINSTINIIFNFLSWIKKTTIKILNNAYNFKVETKRANKFVARSITFLFLSLIFVGVYQSTTTYLQNKSVQKNIKLEEKSIKKKLTEKTTEKKLTEKPIEKKREEKKSVKKQAEVKKKSVREFILPDLNLKTETVLSLFADVKYDLKKVRRDKLVKPIYFTQFPKDLDEIKSVKLKKETFIKIVLPLVVAENQKILDDKYKFKSIVKKKFTTDKEKLWLRQKFKEYKVTNTSVLELEKRIDIIPISIAIAQAAKESGWGTSRFALEGNAIFGQWTWNGRGIAPLERNKEQSHKILRFPILRASVKAYKNNLNTHKSYKKFREKRYDLRKKNKLVEGIKLIHTLKSYAQTGEEYTRILAQMMVQNALEDFENVKLTNTVVKKELNL